MIMSKKSTIPPFVNNNSAAAAPLSPEAINFATSGEKISEENAKALEIDKPVARRGRPKSTLTKKQINVVLADSILSKLDEYAYGHGMTRNSCISLILSQYLEDK